MIRRELISKLLRYGVASALALGVDVGVLWGLSNYGGIHYLWAAAMGFSTGCVVTYLCSKLFVFQDNSQRGQSLTLLLFVLVGVAGLVINHFILYIGVDLIGVSVLLAKVMSAGVVFWFNFILRGTFVFKDPDIYRA